MEVRACFVARVRLAGAFLVHSVLLLPALVIVSLVVAVTSSIATQAARTAAVRFEGHRLPAHRAEIFGLAVQMRELRVCRGGRASVTVGTRAALVECVTMVSSLRLAGVAVRAAARPAGAGPIRGLEGRPATAIRVAAANACPSRRNRAATGSANRPGHARRRVRQCHVTVVPRRREIAARLVTKRVVYVIRCRYRVARRARERRVAGPRRQVCRMAPDRERSNRCLVVNPAWRVDLHRAATVTERTRRTPLAVARSTSRAGVAFVVLAVTRGALESVFVFVRVAQEVHATVVIGVIGRRTGPVRELVILRSPGGSS